MTAPTLEPFTDDHIAAAGALLAERHRRQRQVEPLLSARYEDPAQAGEKVREAWAQEGSAGAVALRDSRVVGYMIGSPRSDEVWGANQWVENAGHAAADPELIRDLYGHLAAGWVEGGRTRHYAVVPATDRAAVDAWFRLSFGQQQGYGIRDVPATAWPPNVRAATADDIDTLMELGPLVEIQHKAAPVFAAIPDDTDDDLRAEIEREIARPELASLVVEADGRVVGSVVVAPISESNMHTGLARPDGQCILGWQATRPEVRGRGTGLALVDGALAWAHEQGYSAMVTDWRVANLFSSRFWPRRGFRPTFLRLYRSIP